MTAERTLSGYIDSVAQPSPVPGAGSVAAIVGSLGCALGEMVCGITRSNPKVKSDERLVAAHNALSESRAKLMELSKQDEEAYSRFRTAQALPKSSPAEKLARAQAMAATLLWATEVPLEIAETSSTALREIVVVASLGSKHALADVTTAAYLLECSILGAMENVRVNVQMMKDPAAVDGFGQLVNEVLLLCDQAMSKVLAEVDARTST